jgi:tripartite-type tricarboxylate transporter receptor subunit TctC
LKATGNKGILPVNKYQSRVESMASALISNIVRFGMGIVLSAIAWSATALAAETWPQRNVRFIVSLPPGSGVDLGARLFADRLSAKWGQPVVVENRPGGDGVIAITSFINAQDDHVLLFAPVSSFSAYDPRDLVPIARVSNTVVVIAVPVSRNINSLKELVELAKAQPSKLNWSTATGVSDFLFEGFEKSGGVRWTKVPYRNTVEALKDLAEGRIDIWCGAYTIARPQVESGKVKLLAVTNHERAPMIAEVPTVKEAGYPALHFDGLVGLFGPKKMSDELRSKIAADIASVADKTMGEKLAVSGQVMSPGKAAEFAVSIEEQRATVAKIATELGIKPASQ